MCSRQAGTAEWWGQCRLMHQMCPFISLACPTGLGLQEPPGTSLGVSYMPSPLCDHLMSLLKDSCGVVPIIIIPCSRWEILDPEGLS